MHLFNVVFSIHYNLNWGIKFHTKNTNSDKNNVIIVSKNPQPPLNLPLSGGDTEGVKVIN
jgi:hypothetical protein